jgi:hypothetical protein
MNLIIQRKENDCWKVIICDSNDKVTEYGDYMNWMDAYEDASLTISEMKINGSRHRWSIDQIEFSISA